jgi:hypothetical protein
VLVRLITDCDADGDELAELAPDPRPTIDGGLSDSATDSATEGIPTPSTDMRDLATGGCRYWLVAAPSGALRTTAGELTALITELLRDTVEAGSGGYGCGEVGRDG